jgi:hypothetical protein
MISSPVVPAIFSTTPHLALALRWMATAEIIEEHAKRCGIPANRISAVRRLMEPLSAEQP